MSTYNPHFPNAPAVFDAAQRFKERCLFSQTSLLSDHEAIWTTDHFDVLVKHYVDQPEVGKGTFYEKLVGQLAGAPSAAVALMAELFWLVELPTNNLAPTYKHDQIRFIWNINELTGFRADSLFLKNDVLSGLGSGGPGYNRYLWMEMIFAVCAFADLMAKPEADRRAVFAAPLSFAEWLNSIPEGKGRQLYHTLCHVFFPSFFERVFSESHKAAVAREYGMWRNDFGKNRPAMDRALIGIRERLEAAHSREIDYYLEDGPVPLLHRPPQSRRSTKAADAFTKVEPLTAEALPDIAASDDEGAVREVENLILYGPPGTGKTREMGLRRGKGFDSGNDSTFVTFHPGYAYEDFFGGLRPVASPDGKGIVVRFEKGPFLKLCEVAHQHPNNRYTLFIDEINRANLAKVFGELITLIEPKKRVGAGSPPTEKGFWITVPGLAEPFGVPDNIDIVATMNTADRSIAMMDIAMRRRFAWREVAPDPRLISPATVGAVDLQRLLSCINDRLEYLLDRDHRIGHGYLTDLATLDDVRDALARRIIPLLEEYFFDDPERVRLALTGSTGASPFFVTRELKPSALFRNAGRLVGNDAMTTFTVGSPDTWTEDAIVRLYDFPSGSASA